MSEKLSDEQIDNRLDVLKIWSVSKNKLITRIEFDNFKEAAFFANMVFSVAEEHFHHPKVCVEYNAVEIDLWTHDVDGLTDKDFDMAEDIEQRLGLFNQGK